MFNEYSTFELAVILFVFVLGGVVVIGIAIGLFMSVCAETMDRWKATERGHEMNDETRDIEF